MSRARQPSRLLSQAVQCRTAGDLPSEERLLKQCLAWAGRGRQQPQEREAVRTARFYTALTACQRLRFDEADEQLAMLGLRARLSDSIWAEQPRLPVPEDFFVRVVDDGLPPSLVEHVAASLHSSSPYWEAHHYDEEDMAFYSHAHVPGQELHAVDQLIEALRPLLEEAAPSVARSVTMAEWWVHQRRHDQWHGHPLHFDTDEQLLRTSRGARLRHPAVSTVVYLSDASPRFGATLVTNQRARAAATTAELATAVHPRPGRVLFFDGSFLHGALPGRPWLTSPEDPKRRLCLMVGWWTCPISPLPASSMPRPLMQVDPSADWVKSLPLAVERHRPVARACRLQRPGLLTPIWADVPGAEHQGEPFSGRFFLTHRKQVDEDMFL